jgi:predicted enzyme related to lactoylglutathione lyase
MTAPAASTTQSEPLTATALTLSLTVKDLSTSVAWYRDVVGFTVDRETVRDGVLRSVAIRAGSVRLLLNLDDGGRGLDRKKGEGFAFMLITSQSIDEVANGIKARGGTLALEPTDMPWGARIMRLVDPDGFRFSIST